MEQKSNIKTVVRTLLRLCLMCVLSSAASCADKPAAEPGGSENRSGGEIGFGVGKNISRGTPVNGLAALADIGVYGYYTGYERWEWSHKNTPSELTTAGYFCNVQLRQSNGWKYSPLKYWPVDPRRKLSFFAYSPYSTGQGGVVPYPLKEADAGAPYVDFTVVPEIKNQKDLLWDAAIDRDIQNRTVAFEMKHALTAVNFTAALADQSEVDEGYTVAVKKITVTPLYATGKLDLTYGTWTIDTSSPAAAEFAVEGADLTGYVFGDDTASHPLLSKDTGVMMFIPQDVSGVYATFMLEFDNGNGDITNAPIAFDLGQLDMAWEAGKSINYELKIKGKFINIHTTIQPWPISEPSSGEVNP